MPNNNRTSTFCSFCGRSETEVDHLIAGNGVFICDECIEVCYSLLNQSEYNENGHRKPQKKQSRRRKKLSRKQNNAKKRDWQKPKPMQ